MSKDTKVQRVTQAQDRPSVGQRDEEEYKDLEFDCQVDGPALVPEGVYEFGFIRAEQARLWTQQKVFLWFKIITAGDHVGKRLYFVANVPSKDRMAMSSRYWQAWTLAAGRRPKRRDKLSTSVFRKKVFLGRVRTVKKKVDKDSKHTARAPEQQYSVIDELIQVCAGGPAF